MDNQKIKELADKYGTPTFVFDEKSLKERMRKIKEIVGDTVSLCYSIKANPFLIPAMEEVTDRLEVCSPGELDICKALHVPSEKIVYSGVCKTRENVKEAVEYGAYAYTAESVLHVEYLQMEGREKNKKLPVLLRLNAGSQFGMPKSDVLRIIENRDKFDFLDIVGIHYFAGTQRGKIKQQIEELKMLADFFDDVKTRYGFVLERLEYGPGLPVSYFANESFEDTLKPVKELADALKDIASRCRLTVEMGRFFVSECGMYLSKVMDIKSNKDTNYMIIDGGMNHVTYLGQVMGMKVPVIEHIKGDGDENAAGYVMPAVSGMKDENEEKDYAICGSLCTTADVLVRKVSFKNLEIGDLLVFFNIGAYSVTEGIYLFLSRTMPRIVLIKEDGTTALVRDYVETSKINTINKYL